MTMVMRRASIAICSTILLAAPVVAFQPSAGQGEFVPIDQLPPADQLPAAPLLIAAYAFVWAVLMFYLWSIWRRLGKVEGDMRSLEQRSANRNRAR
jgi:CcmD family protein